MAAWRWNISKSRSNARPDVQAFMAKVSSEVDGSIGPDVEINLGFAKRLVVQTTDGRTLESGDARCRAAIGACR